MRVFYGFSYLTPKIVRKAELAVYFENDNHNPSKNEEWVHKHIKVVHVRKQTIGEVLDARLSNRIWTKFRYFIDEKPYYGNIDKVLEQNYLADANNLPDTERMLIRRNLREEYFKFFKRKETAQLSIIFN